MKQRGLKINLHQEMLEVLFEEVFRSLHFKPDVVNWMQETLLAEHHEKSSDHKQHVAALRRRYEMLQTYIDRGYEDKLSGDLDDVTWKRKNETWRLEMETIQRQIDSLNDTKQDYIDRGVELIELVQNLETVYKSATSEKKRRLIEIVSSNHVLRNGKLCFDYRKPFDLLAESSEKEKWLGKLDEFRTWCFTQAA